MLKADLCIVLSGSICKSQSTGMSSFWGGYIELQRKLPVSRQVKHIVIHSWNPELADLVKLVYSPSKECYEQQYKLYPSLLRLTNKSDCFGSALDRINSKWGKVNIQTLLLNACSKTRAINLLNELSVNQEQVLITSWDLGQAGSSEVNQLVTDAALPVEYIYFAYSSEVDVGYSDIWMLAPAEIAKKFNQYDEFVMSSVLGENRYLEEFCETGWPRARAKNRFKKIISHLQLKRVRKIALKTFDFIEDQTKNSYILNRITRKFISLIKFIINPPLLTAENSCFPEVCYSPRIFPHVAAINSQALLKYFVFQNGLRDKTRFLSQCDFQISKQIGQIINPQPVVLIVWNLIVDDDCVLDALLKSSPLPLITVIHLGEITRVWTKDNNGDWGSINLNPSASSTKEQLRCSLKFLDSELYRSLPILILPKLKIYSECSDWFYLNALLKYVVYSRLDYVGLSGGGAEKPNLDFPDIYFSKSQDIFSLKSGIFTLNGISSFIQMADSDLDIFTDEADEMQFEFPVVSRSVALFFLDEE